MINVNRLRPSVTKKVAARCLVLLMLFVSATVAEERPFEVLFSNDTTNIVSCRSPFNPEAGPFREDFLRATVDEAAGATVQMLQPGLGWVPWWKSDFLPMKEHVDWLEKNGRKPNSFENYVLDGGDMVAVFVDECRKKNVSPFISLRMNDLHHVYRGGAEADPDKIFRAMSEFRFFAEHPELLLGERADRDRRMQYAFDFAKPEVLEYKLDLIREIVRYDIDGLELDFMRHWALFHPERTDTESRLRIMTELIVKIRQILDESSKPGRKRRLCVRIPGYPGPCDMMGGELRRWAEAGVDMFNLSAHYNTDFLFDLDAVKKALPTDSAFSSAFYPELHFAVAAVPKLPGDKGPTVHRRTTVEQIVTAAHVAAHRGAGGVSFFNFHYYRGTKSPTDVVGSAVEPPFSVFAKLHDRDWMASQPQHYAAAFTYRHTAAPKLFEKPIAPNAEPTEILLDMAPPKNGWKNEGRLRIQATESLVGTDWEVSINGSILSTTDDVSEPFEPLSDAGLGGSDDYRAWTVPVACLRDGMNRIRLSLKKGAKPVRVFYLDISLK